MRVSVILPVKDDPPVFEAVASVLAGAADVEFFVVDNGSAPDFRASLDTLPPSVRVLDEPRPGPSAARNRGLDEATGDVIFFIDADCVPAPGWMAAGLAGLEATGADLLRGAATMAGDTNAARLIHASFRKRRKSVPGDTVRLDTRNMAARRRVFDSLRFNEASIRGEDIEFGMRAEELGFRTAYWPAMRVSHEHEGELNVFLAKKVVGGWHLRAVAAASPSLRWPMKRPRLLPNLAARTKAFPGQAAAMRGLLLGIVWAGWALDTAGRFVPTRAGGLALKVLGSGAAAAGAALHDGGYAPPAWQDALHGRIRRPA